MKRTLKILCSTMLAASIMLNVSACNGLNSSKAKDAKSNEPIKLKFVWWGTDNRKDLTLKAIKLFEQKHSQIKFETQAYPNTQTIATDLAMNTADEVLPDIIQLNYDTIHNYANRNLLEPFDSYIKQKILDVSNVNKEYLKSGMDNNKIYGLTFTVNAYCMIIAPSAFEKAGVSIPSSGYTYDDLYQTAKQLKENIKEDDFYPLANFVDFNSYIRSTGSTYYNSTGTALGYTNDDVFVSYFNLQKKFLKEGLLAPSSVTNGRSNKDALIVLGKSAFNFGVSNNIKNYSVYTKDPLKIISVPSYTAGKITSFIRPSMYLGVSSYSQHKKEAVEFIDFLTNDIDANNILMCERGIPISSKVSDAMVKNVGASDKEQFSLIDYLKGHSSPIDPPTPDSSGGVNSLFSRLSNEILSDKITPEEGAKQFRSGANNILSGVKGGQ